MLEIPDPDGYLFTSDVEDAAEEAMMPPPLLGAEGALDPSDIWLTVILACTNQNPIRYICNDTGGTLCDDTVFRWLNGDRVVRARSRNSYWWL